MAKKQQKVAFRVMQWANVNVCKDKEGTDYNGQPLKACAISGGENPVIFISEPFQDVDGKVKYLRFDSEAGKWDENPKIAQISCSPKDTKVILSCC